MPIIPAPKWATCDEASAATPPRQAPARRSAPRARPRPSGRRRPRQDSVAHRRSSRTACPRRSSTASCRACQVAVGVEPGHRQLVAGPRRRSPAIAAWPCSRRRGRAAALGAPPPSAGAAPRPRQELADPVAVLRRGWSSGPEARLDRDIAGVSDDVAASGLGHLAPRGAEADAQAAPARLQARRDPVDAVGTPRTTIERSARDIVVDLGHHRSCASDFALSATSPLEPPSTACSARRRQGLADGGPARGRRRRDGRDVARPPARLHEITGHRSSAPRSPSCTSTSAPTTSSCSPAPRRRSSASSTVLLGPGDHAIVTWPGYQSLYEVGRAAGAEVTLHELREGQRWSLESSG